MPTPSETPPSAASPGETTQTRMRAPKPPPGTLIASPDALQPAIDVIAYGPNDMIEEDGVDLARVADLRGRFPNNWINVTGLGDTKLISALGETFGLHNLALEDVLNTDQRAKIEDYDDHLFIVARMVSRDTDLFTEQVSLFHGPDYVIMLQERPGDCFDPLRDRIRRGRPRLRSGATDYLVYSMLDCVIDDYFPLADELDDRLASLETEILEGAGDDTVRRIHAIKGEMRYIVRTLRPMRELIEHLVSQPPELFGEVTRPFLRDAHDHMHRVLDLLDAQHSHASDLMDLYLSLASHRMNEIMKVLTVIASIFIPLTFIAGIYGMNFDASASPWNMPELHSPYGYPAVITGMGFVAVGMALLFRRWGWIESLKFPGRGKRDGAQ